MRSLAKFWALTRDERSLLLGSLWRLSWARLQTRCLPFRKVAASLGTTEAGQHGRSPSTFSDPSAAVRWSTAVLSARLPWCRNCLAQAVAAKRYLDRQGLSSTLYLGVTTEPGAGDLEAHAWLEAGGRILIGESDTEYEIIYRQT